MTNLVFELFRALFNIMSDLISLTYNDLWSLA